jgi:chromosome segregation ATPase
MSVSPPAGQTAAAIDARRASTEAMLGRIRNTLKQMRRERAQVTVAAVARRATVSRTFLYQNPAARTLVADATAAAGDQRLLDRAEQAAHIEAPWRERALNAEDALKQAHQEITLQRTTIAGLLGKVHDLEADLPEDGVQRLITENTTLKQNVRQLTQDNQRLNERLQGARDNNRFLDKRISDLEAQLVADGTDLGIHRTTNTRSQREISASPSAE